MELLLLAFALAMDSVALSIASGAKCRALTVSGVIKVSFIFGFFSSSYAIFGIFFRANLRKLHSFYRSFCRIWHTFIFGYQNDT